MSSASGSSTGNMPPRHEKKLVDVMDEAFRTNSKDEEEEIEEDKIEHNEKEEPREEEPLIEQPQGYTMSSVYPPQPCERCVRSKKTCKGVAGSRCEHCKALHQKCSNSTGPPRGKQSGKRPSPVAPVVEDGSPGPFSTQGRPKRKAATKKSNLAENEEDEEDEEELYDKPVRPRKQPRVGDTLGTHRSRLQKEVTELEGAIKKLQSTFTKDLAKLLQIAESISSEIREMDSK